MLKTNSSEQAYVEGGPLKNSYSFVQLHFHWGQNDREGSEDLINNHSFAMEMHAVFYNNRYQSMEYASSRSDGLAVLSFFFEVKSLLYLFYIFFFFFFDDRLDNLIKKRNKNYFFSCYLNEQQT